MKTSAVSYQACFAYDIGGIFQLQSVSRTASMKFFSRIANVSRELGYGSVASARGKVASPRRRYQRVLDIAHTAGVLAGGLIFSLCMAGVPIAVAAKLTVYSMVLFGVAGHGFSRLSAFGSGSEHYRISLSLLIGISIVPTVAFAAYVAGHLHLTNLAVLLLPVVLLGISLRQPEIGGYIPVDLKLLYVPVLIASILAPVCVLSLSENSSMIAHASFQAVTASALSSGWPPESPFAAGVPIAYHYGVHLLLLLKSITLGLSTDTLVDNAAQTLLFWFLIWGVTTLAAYWLRLTVLAYVALPVAVFGVLGRTMPFDLLTVLRNIPFTGIFTLSPHLGHLMLVVSLFVLAKVLASDDRSSVIGGTFLLAMLGFSAGLVRTGSTGALLACTASAFWLYLVATRRRIEPVPTMVVFIVGVTCIAGAVATLGVPGSFSGTGFLRFSIVGGIEFIGSYQHLAYVELTRMFGLSAFAAGLVGVAVSILLAANFLSPTLWIYLSRWRKLDVPAGEIMLLMALVIGTLVSFVTVAPGASHLVINQTATCCAAMLGARGLDQFLDGSVRGATAPRRGFAWLAGAALTMALLAVHVHDASIKVVREGVIQRSFVERDPERRAKLAPEMDLRPILSHIDDVSAVSFLFPTSRLKGLSPSIIWSLMSRHQIKLLAFDYFAHLSSQYGGSTGDGMKELDKMMSAAAADALEGTLDLRLARKIIENSFAPDRRTVVIGHRDMEIVEDSAFAFLAEAGIFRAWTYLPNETN